MNAFGNLPAFLFIWSFVIIMIPASFALTALTFADYTLQIFFENCDPPYSARLLLAAAAIGKISIMEVLFYGTMNVIRQKVVSENKVEFSQDLELVKNKTSA